MIIGSKVRYKEFPECGIFTVKGINSERSMICIVQKIGRLKERAEWKPIGLFEVVG